MSIRIKRSSGNSAPVTLAAGQMAYAEGAGGTALGGALFYGEIGGTVRNIGGKWLVDKVNNLASSDISNFSTAVDARIANAVLNDLSNVQGTPSNGQVLTYNTSGGYWEPQAPGSGVTTFVALNDTPVSFSGAGGYFVRVNSGATALEFVQDIDDGTF